MNLQNHRSDRVYVVVVCSEVQKTELFDSSTINFVFYKCARVKVSLYLQAECRNHLFIQKSNVDKLYTLQVLTI